MNKKRLILPKIDFAFKLLFGDEKNKDVTKGFIQDILKIEIAEIEYATAENSRDTLRNNKESKDKNIIELKLNTKSMTKINLQIQVLQNSFIFERSLYQWSKMYSSQIKYEEGFNKLEKCVIISILDFYCFEINKPYSKWVIKENDTNKIANESFEMYFLELPKLFDRTVSVSEDDKIIQWMHFIDGSDLYMIEKLKMNNEFIENGAKVLEAISNDERTFRLYEARQKELSDQNMYLKSARDNGFNEGRFLAKLENAKNMLSFDIDKSIISECTGLTITQIENL